MTALLVVASAHAQDTPDQVSRSTSSAIVAGSGAKLAGDGATFTGQARTAPARRSVVDSWYSPSAGPAPSFDAGDSAARIWASMPLDRMDGAEWRQASPKGADQASVVVLGRRFLVTPSGKGARIALGRADVNGDPDAGFAAYLDFAQSNGSSVPEDSQIALDLLYRAPFAGRPGDVVGLSLTRTHANSRKISGETIANAEGNQVSPTQRPQYSTMLFYRFALAPGLAVRPSLQLISDPGGAPGNRSGLVAGIKVVAAF